GFVVDQASALFADPERVHPITHAGRFFTVRGPLNVPRPVQGQPVIVHRDMSRGPARTGIAASAEIVLGEAVTAEAATAERSAWRTRAAASGRGPESLRYVVRVMPILAETAEAAHRRAQDLDRMAQGLDGAPAMRFVGTPAGFAAQLADWTGREACDG